MLIAAGIGLFLLTRGVPSSPASQASILSAADKACKDVKNKGDCTDGYKHVAFAIKKASDYNSLQAFCRDGQRDLRSCNIGASSAFAAFISKTKNSPSFTADTSTKKAQQACSGTSGDTYDRCLAANLADSSGSSSTPPSSNPAGGGSGGGGSAGGSRPLAAAANPSSSTSGDPKSTQPTELNIKTDPKSSQDCADNKAVKIGTTGLTGGTKCIGDKNTNPIFVLLAAIIRYAVGILALIFVGIIVLSGILYITSNGEPEKTKEAKDRLQSAITGMVLLALMAAILNAIIPGGII